MGLILTTFSKKLFNNNLNISNTERTKNKITYTDNLYHKENYKMLQSKLLVRRNCKPLYINTKLEYPKYLVTRLKSKSDSNIIYNF